MITGLGGHIEALRNIVGPEGLIAEPDDLRSYEVSARYPPGKAGAVVRPASTPEMSTVVAYCVRAGIRVIPQAGNTGVVGGSTPSQSGHELIVSVGRLRGPISLDAPNRTVTADAGLRLSALNAALRPHDLWFPIDLGSDPMVGGMVASNTGGARFIRYGDVRRNLRGLEVVLADEHGTVLDLMSGLRKDNTGIDFRQLFAGSSGAFGIVTRAELEVHRRPQQTATALLVPRDDDMIVELLLAMEAGAGEYLSAFEGISKNALQYALANIQRLTNPFGNSALPDYSVLVELSRCWPAREGELPLQEVLEQCVGPLLAGNASPQCALLNDALIGKAEDLWAIRHSLSDGLRCAGQVVAFDLSLRRGDVAAFRRGMAACLAVAFPEFEVCDFGHVGDGGMHYNLLAPHGVLGEDAAERIRALRHVVVEHAVGRFGASFSGEHALGRSNQDLYDRYKPVAIKRLSGQIQGALAAGPLGSVRLGLESQHGT